MYFCIIKRNTYMKKAVKYLKLKDAYRQTGIETYNLRNMILRKEIEGMRRGVKIWMVGFDENGELIYLTNQHGN